MITGHNCDVRSSGQACDIWALELTFTAGGAPVLTTAVGEGQAWTDFDPRVPEATGTIAGGAGLEDGGAGILLFRFPSSRRARPRSVYLEPLTKVAANFRNCTITDIDAVAGTAKVFMCRATDGALTDPEVGSKLRIAMELEYR